jgi:hypothetical protein
LRRIALLEAASLEVAPGENFAPGTFADEIRPVAIAKEGALRSKTRRAEEAEGARRGYSTGA